MFSTGFWLVVGVVAVLAVFQRKNLGRLLIAFSAQFGKLFKWIWGIDAIAVYQAEVDRSADEIQQACYFYMENQGQLKMNHKGEPIDAIVVENFIAPQNLVIEGRPIKKGTWLMSVKINDAAIWKDIKDGNLTGFSMAGFAQGELC